MGLFKKKEGYVTAGQDLIAKGGTLAAMQAVIEGLDDYQNRIIRCLQGCPVVDTALVVTALRAKADNLESEHPDCKGLVADLKKRVKPPDFQNTTKVERTRKR